MTADQARLIKHIYDAYRAQLRVIMNKHRSRLATIADQHAQAGVRAALQGGGQ